MSAPATAQGTTTLSASTSAPCGRDPGPPWLDGEPAGKAGVLRDASSVADAYLFTATNWSGFLGVDNSGLAYLNACRARVGARPGMQAAMKTEGVAE